MKQLHLYPLLSLLLIVMSCSGQDEPQKEVPASALESTQTNDQDEFDPYFIETSAISSAEGPKSITRSMLQDQNGTYWLASWEGIISYDGTTFTNHMNRDGLRRWHTFSCMEASNGDLWFGTIGAGMYVYDGENFKNISTLDGLAADRTGCIMEASDGVIWIGTEDGITTIDGDELYTFTEEDGLISRNVNSIIEDKQGRIWIGARGISYIYDGDTFTVLENDEGLKYQNIRRIIEDRNGNIWWGGSDGVWKYDGTQYTQIDERFGGYVYEDSKGVIWVSASAGQDYHMALYRVNPGVAPSVEPYLEKIYQPQGQVFDIMEDDNGHIWFGLENGFGVWNGTEVITSK